MWLKYSQDIHSLAEDMKQMANYVSFVGRMLR